jgi:hypothetical protein
MAPLLVIAAGFLALTASGIPLLRKMPDLVRRFPEGNTRPAGPPDPDDVAALDRHVHTDLSRLHATHGHWLIVAAWILVPLAGFFPLTSGWRGVRRKGLALFATIVLLAFLFLFLLVESFTGHLIGGMFREPTGIARGPMLRFTVLHALGFPLLTLLTLGALVWVQGRLAKRAEPPTGPGPSSDRR